MGGLRRAWPTMRQCKIIWCWSSTRLVLFTTPPRCPGVPSHCKGKGDEMASDLLSEHTTYPYQVGIHLHLTLREERVVIFTTRKNTVTATDLRNL